MEADPASETCEAIEPLLAAVALGEEEEATLATVAAHLAACPGCRGALAAYQNIAALLPLTAAEAAPRPSLRRDVIDAVDAAARGRPRRPAAPQAWGRFWPLAVRAGLALVFTLLLAWNLSLQQNLTLERVARREQSQVFTTLLESGRLERLPLQADLPGPSGSLLLDPQGHTAALRVADMPPLPAGRVYQLWLVQGDRRLSGGTFTIDPSGAGLLLITAPEPLSAYQAVGVTVEPRGGSPGPTTPRVIGARLTS